MLGDRKKLAALIVADAKPKAKDDDGGYEDGLEAAAEELIAALKDGDAKTVAECFRSMHDICTGE